MREEGAVGGSVAGSTAGWWPSDRDRFPPRFLLPPSLQTHNCIISTHLASSSLPAFPPSLILSFSSLLSFFLPPSLSLFLFFLRLPALRSPLFTIRPGVRLRAFASLSSSCPTSRPTASPSLSFFLPSPSSTSSPLFFRTKALPHARNGPPPSSFPAASLHGVDAMMLFSRSHHSATRVQQRLSLSLPLISRSERSCREFTSSFFLHFVHHLRLVLSSLFLRIS